MFKSDYCIIRELWGLASHVEDEGLREEFQNAVKEAHRMAKEEFDTIEEIRYEEFQSGYEDGAQSGYDEGYEHGHDEGYENGHDDGYKKGREETLREFIACPIELTQRLKEAYV